MKKTSMRSKRGFAGTIGRLSMTQARSYNATLSSKKGAEGMRKALELAGSRVKVSDVKRMLKRRIKKAQKSKR